MEIPKVVQELLDKKAEMYNTVYLDAYANGLIDMYRALQLQQTGVSTCFLEDYEDHFFEVKYKQVSCCKIAPITDENYCPKCGKKILK